jgi:hypothetical protein
MSKFNSIVENILTEGFSYTSPGELVFKDNKRAKEFAEELNDEGIMKKDITVKGNTVKFIYFQSQKDFIFNTLYSRINESVLTENSFKPGDWLIQPHRDEPVYAIITDKLVNGGYKVVSAGGWSGTKAKTESTKNWYPVPQLINKKDIPSKFIKAIEKKKLQMYGRSKDPIVTSNTKEIKSLLDEVIKNSEEVSFKVDEHDMGKGKLKSKGNNYRSSGAGVFFTLEDIAIFKNTYPTWPIYTIILRGDNGQFDTYGDEWTSNSYK